LAADAWMAGLIGTLAITVSKPAISTINRRPTTLTLPSRATAGNREVDG